MPDFSTLPPLREGMLQLEPPRLMGSRCADCGTRVFPARMFCPACDSDAAPVSVALSPEGRVFAYTVVRQAPGKRPVPYTLAYVDLDDGVRVMAQLDHPMQDLRIGLRVGLVLRNTVPAPGDPRLGYAFAGIGSKTETP